MPNSYFRRQVLEDALAIDFYREVAAFALGAFVAFARLEPLHQVYGGTKCQGHLLMPATNSEHGLRRFLDYFKNAGQRLRRVSVPRVTLTAENYVGRSKRLDAFKRNRVKRLGEYLHSFAHSTQNCSQLARASSLAIKRVVDEINQEI